MLQALYSELLTYCNFCSISRSNDFIYSSFSMAVLLIPLDFAINVNFPLAFAFSAYLSTELFSALKSFSNLLFFSFHVKISSSTSFFLSDILAVSFTLLFSSRAASYLYLPLAADRSNSLQNAAWGTPPALCTWSQITRWATSACWATLIFSTITSLSGEKCTLWKGRPEGIRLKKIFLIFLIRNALKFILNSKT